jgi:phage terminase large subunit-like protein
VGLRGPRARPKKAAAAATLRPVHRRVKAVGLAERVIAFVQSLVITKGILCGERMTLLPHQIEFIYALYGRESVVRLAIQSLPRGNGKSGLEAALCLAHMLLDGLAEERGEIYAAALDKVQSSLMFDEIAAIVERTPEFDAICNVQRWVKRIEVLSGPGRGTVFQALSSDARRAHSISPTFAVCDEVGSWDDIELLNNMLTAAGKRARSRLVAISTQAANDAHPFSQLIDDGLRGLDPSVYVQLLAAPPDADPFAEETWRACNPALGHFLDFKEFASQAARAKRVPTFEPVFQNLRLNRRVAIEERWLTDAQWNACREDVSLDSLVGQRCFGGLDLSSTRDLTAFALHWPDSGHLAVWAWLPRETLAEREHDDRVPYRVWAQQHYVELTPGSAIDKRTIALRLGELVAKYQPAVVAADRWGLPELERSLKDEGIDVPLKPHGQGFRDMSPSTRVFEAKVLNKEVKHNGSPLLAWSLSNVVLERDAAGNAKPNKQKSRERIDPVIAAVMAVGVAASEPAAAPQPRISWL